MIDEGRLIIYELITTKNEEAQNLRVFNGWSHHASQCPRLSIAS